MDFWWKWVKRPPTHLTILSLILDVPPNVLVLAKWLLIIIEKALVKKEEDTTFQLRVIMKAKIKQRIGCYCWILLDSNTLLTGWKRGDYMMRWTLSGEKWEDGFYYINKNKTKTIKKISIYSSKSEVGVRNGGKYTRHFGNLLLRNF